MDIPDGIQQSGEPGSVWCISSLLAVGMLSFSSLDPSLLGKACVCK